MSHQGKHHQDQDCDCKGEGEQAGCDCGKGCSCGGECGCGSCHCGGECNCNGNHFQRRFRTKAEQIVELEAYLSELKLEVQAVEEILADLKK